MEKTQRVNPCFEDEEVMKVNSSIPNNQHINSLEDLAKKSIYSSYRSRDNRFQMVGFVRKQQKHIDTRSEKQSDKRAYSVKEALSHKKSLMQIVLDKKNPNDYSQNLFKLKLQEMCFKLKAKIATLLKQIQIPLTQFSRFTSLNRIDEILEFLAESVKKRLNKDQATKKQNVKTLSKERELLLDYEQQIDNLKKKQVEKETIQKTYKAKLKESHAQIRDLYDKINQKQREISQKMTQMYQLKSLSSQSNKLVQNYKLKCISAEKHIHQELEKQALQTKKVINTYKHIEEQNLQLKQKNEELNQIIKNQKEKQYKILSLNQHLSQEIERWKERLSSNIIQDVESRTSSTQSRKTKQNEVSQEFNPLSGKLSKLTLENQIIRLNYKTKQLQKQNRHLSRQLINHISIKQKYEQLLDFQQSNHSLSDKSIEPVVNVSQKWKNMLGQQQLYEVQNFYKRKIEQVVKQWRDKMVEMIGKSQQQQQKYKIELNKLQKANQELENKVYELANEKYLVENKLIEKERELYEISRKNEKRLRSNTPSVRTQAKSEVITIGIQVEKNNQESGVQSIDEKNI